MDRTRRLAERTGQGQVLYAHSKTPIRQNVLLLPVYELSPSSGLISSFHNTSIQLSIVYNFEAVQEEIITSTQGISNEMVTYKRTTFNYGNTCSNVKVAKHFVFDPVTYSQRYIQDTRYKNFISVSQIDHRIQ